MIMQCLPTFFKEVKYCILWLTLFQNMNSVYKYRAMWRASNFVSGSNVGWN